MPAQQVSTRTAYYEENDTAPALRRQLLDGDGLPVDLTGATVTITIAASSYDYYYSPKKKIVDGDSVTVEAGTDGWVQWEPGVGVLSPPGTYQYRFKATFPGGLVQTFPPRGYETLIVSTPVGGV